MSLKRGIHWKDVAVEKTEEWETGDFWVKLENNTILEMQQDCQIFYMIFL